VSPEGDIKSVGHELTFEQDKYKKDEIEKALLYLASKTGRRLRKKKLLGRTVQLKLRYENFETLTRDKTSPKPLDSTLLIYKTALSMVQSLFPLKKKVRLVGVRVTNLSCIPVSQYNLFEDEDSHGLLDDEKLRDMDKAEDRVVEKFGEKAIFRASLLKKNQGKSSPFSEDD
jgi:DNA polymerase-4